MSWGIESVSLHTKLKLSGNRDKILMSDLYLLPVGETSVVIIPTDPEIARVSLLSHTLPTKSIKQ